jgi:hypothetical protein
MTIVTLVSGWGNAYPGTARATAAGRRAMGERIGVSRDLLITTL